MFSIPHLILIFVIALIAFGPEKLPQLARTLGKAMAEFRKVTGDLRRVVDDEMREIERAAREAEIRKRDAAGQQSLPGATGGAGSGVGAAVATEIAAVPPLPDEHVIAPPAVPSQAPPGTVPTARPNGAESAPAAADPSPEQELTPAPEPIHDAKS